MKKLYLLLPIFILFACFSDAQNNSRSKIFETYDALVGTDNTGLYNGTEFTDLYLNTDGSYRYFNGFDYAKGSVTYNGQYYVNASLKYDLLEDNLIARSDDNLSIFNIKLIPEFVDSFSIYNLNFVRITDINLGLSGNGYFEVAYLGEHMELYIKHAKRKKDKAKNGALEYKFTDDIFYMLKNSGKYSVIRSVKDIRKSLPKYEDDIRQFYKTYRALYKSDRGMFMARLVKHLESLTE